MPSKRITTRHPDSVRSPHVIGALITDGVAPFELGVLCEAFHLSAFERDVVLLCAGMELEGSIPARCAAAHGDPRKTYPTFGLALAVLATFGACNKADEGLTARQMESNNKVLECQKDLAHAKDEIGGLKRQVAQAIAEPSKIRLDDPEIIQLVASRKGPPSGAAVAPMRQHVVVPGVDRVNRQT